MPKPKPRLTQSETLKIGERKEYIIVNPKTAELAKRCGITCWVEKRKADVTKEQRQFSTFTGLPTGYEHVYGICFARNEYDCGDLPRDLGKVIRGIAIGLGKL